MQHGIDAAAQHGKEEGHIERHLGVAAQLLAENIGHKGADKGTHALQAFESQVRDAGALGIDTADGHDEKGQGKTHAVNNDGVNCVQHFSDLLSLSSLR